VCSSFPIASKRLALVSGSRWLREHVPGANAAVNMLRGQAGSQPFTPTHVYRTEDVLRILDATGEPAAYLTLEDHGDVSSVIAMTEWPISARLKSRAPAAGTRLRDAERRRRQSTSRI
jgi:hypothetical protein